MIVGFHKINSGNPLTCITKDCKSPATIALHEEWRPGEPVDFQRGSNRFLFYCQKHAEQAIREQEKGCVR